MPRSRLGPLAIESKLGDDPATSSVWRAIHVSLKRSVAVKIFPAPFGGTPEGRAAFSEEWEVLKKVQHPALARCFGGGFDDTDAYLAYELIEGETLASQLQRKSRLSWESVLDMAEPLADGLDYLHRSKLVHGAICPSKIMIAGLSPVLLDVRHDRFATPYKTNKPLSIAESSLLGPELLTNPQPTTSSDLYALGAVLYWAVTGDPPITGSTIEEVRGNIEYQTPISPATIVLDCPIWFDKLIMQLLDKNPAARPPSASAVKLALAEVRKRAMSRTGVAEHASAGFSPLQVTDQKQKDEARTLLGRGVVDLEKKERAAAPDYTLWHDKTWVLVGSLIVILAGLAWIAWPAGESALRTEAEELLAVDTRSALSEAKLDPLRQLITRFPDSENAVWAREQIDHIDVRLFLHALSVKIKNNLAIKNQGELLHKQAQQFADVGDTAKALDKYRSIVTVLGDDPKYSVAVNAARSQIAALENSNVERTEASEIVERRLKEADQHLADGRVVEARKIWYGLIELYGDNSNLSPLIQRAQDRLQQSSIDRQDAAGSGT